MKDAASCADQASLVVEPGDVNAALASLQRAGADKFDPVHLHYLQVLAKRSNTHQGQVKSILDAKLAQALATFTERFAQAHTLAGDSIAQIVAQSPTAATELQARLDAGDLKGVRQFIASLKTSAPRASLADLTRHLAQQTPDHVDAGFEGMFHAATGLRRELKTTRYFRNTWSKLSVEKRVTQALRQAPKNAGPINSHSLVLRSLALMRDISPDYLNQFTSYVDTLFCLDQWDQEKPVSAHTSADGDHSKKVKGRRTTRKPS